MACVTVGCDADAPEARDALPAMTFRVNDALLAREERVDAGHAAVLVRPPVGWVRVPPAEVSGTRSVANWISTDGATLCVWASDPWPPDAESRVGRFALNGYDVTQRLRVGRERHAFVLTFDAVPDAHVELCVPVAHYARLLPAVESTLGTLLPVTEPSSAGGTSPPGATPSLTGPYLP